MAPWLSLLLFFLFSPTTSAQNSPTTSTPPVPSLSDVIGPLLQSPATAPKNPSTANPQNKDSTIPAITAKISSNSLEIKVINPTSDPFGANATDSANITDSSFPNNDSLILKTTLSPSPVTDTNFSNVTENSTEPALTITSTEDIFIGFNDTTLSIFDNSSTSNTTESDWIGSTQNFTTSTTIYGNTTDTPANDTESIEISTGPEEVPESTEEMEPSLIAVIVLVVFGVVVTATAIGCYYKRKTEQKRYKMDQNIPLQQQGRPCAPTSYTPGGEKL